MFCFAQTSAVLPVPAPVSFFEALGVAFPGLCAILIFAVLVLAGFFLGKILKNAGLCFSEKIYKHCGKRGTSLFIAVNALFRALPIVFVAAGILVYRQFYFPGISATGTPEFLAAGLLLSRAFWLFVVVAQTQILWYWAELPLRFILRYAEGTKGNPAFATLVPITGVVLQTLILCWGVLLGVRILTDTQPAEILAMIGIGGLAIGLASQDTVKNFFGTAMLIIDRPFTVGDIIDFGTGTPATVVRIGARSTRLRTFEDHEISIPNADLANRIVTTISAREKIRREMNLGLTYDTSPEKIEEAVSVIKSVLTDSGKLAPGNAPLVFFSDFNDFSLNIRVIYAYADSDVVAANAFAHSVNLEILRRFNAAGIRFAFPTQTVELKQI